MRSLTVAVISYERYGASRGSLDPNDPAHRGIMPQPLGIVYILVSSEASEHRLPQQADESMPAVPARARVGEFSGLPARQIRGARHLGWPER
jgi:hypothetical protein